MGREKRLFNKWFADYKASLRPYVKQVIGILPENSKKIDYVNKFRYLFPDLWCKLQIYHKYYREKNKALIRRHKQVRYHIPAPSRFISYLVEDHKNQVLSKTIALKKEWKINESCVREKSKRRLRNRRNAIKHKTRYVQRVEPLFLTPFLEAYRKTSNPETHLIIMNSLSHFCSQRIISFFYGVNAGNPCFELHEHAMRYIQSLGLPFKLKGKKKGRKSARTHAKPVIDDNPANLKREITDKDLEAMKEFHVFVSHCSKDEEEIIPMMQKINKYNLTAYIDWVNDRERLSRAKASADTAEVIKNRIKQSRFFLFVVTPASLQSTWCSWEIGYASALNKPICLYITDNTINDLPEYLTLNYHMEVSGDISMKGPKGEIITLEKWVDMCTAAT